jgi:hypothetical protein
MEADVVYYRRRSAEESAAAEAAVDSRVRQVHLDLAALYADRLTSIETHSTENRLQLVSAA